MSASWFLVSMYLIWILGSKLILSNNQPRATLWDLDTCLIVGLRPLSIILNHGFVVFKDVQLRFTLRRMCVGGYVIHLTQLRNLRFPSDMLGLGLGIKNCPVSWWLACLGWTLLLVERNTSITMSQRSRADNPSIRNPASREMISDSVELCETEEVCFLHIQLTGTNVLLPEIHKTPPEVDF